MTKYRELVKQIPADGEFFNSHAGDVYAECLQSLIEAGWSEHNSIQFLKELYYAAASCYGG